MRVKILKMRNYSVIYEYVDIRKHSRYLLNFIYTQPNCGI